MTAARIAESLSCHFDRRRILIVPNVSWGMGIDEADLTLLYPSGWMDEIEIKVSVSDFRKEATKKARKHEELRRGRPGWKNGKDFSLDQDWDNPVPHLIRRFYFALPRPVLLKVEAEIRSDFAHAGVLEVVETGPNRLSVREHIPAPKLEHARKLTVEEQYKLARLGCLKYWDLRDKQAVQP